MLVFLASPDAKVLYFASGDAKVPNANVFAFWWNIGFSLWLDKHKIDHLGIYLVILLKSDITVKAFL